MKNLAFVLAYLILPASAVELIQVKNQTDQVVSRQGLAVSDQLTERLGTEVAIRLVSFAQVTDLLADTRDPALVTLPPVFFAAALDAGWAPLMGYQPDIALGMYQLEPGPIERLGTPPAESLAARLSQAVYPHPVDERLPLRDHTSCIRAVITARVDGCVTAPFFVKQYLDRFGITLNLVGELYPLPPPVLFANEAVTASQRMAVTASSIQAGGRFTYVDFDLIGRDRYDAVASLLSAE